MWWLLKSKYIFIESKIQPRVYAFIYVSLLFLNFQLGFGPYLLKSEPWM
jgi:hypothetical protein